jgi:alpha-beta hydrolase superfamily lysophospholipase
MAFAGYNSKFPKEEGKNAWLTSCSELIEGRDDDKYTSFRFTESGYRELFYMLGKCNSKKWFSEYPKNMKTLIMSGDMDPVGNYGKGPAYVYKKLLVEGCTDVSMKLYAGARHELFNEFCREEAFADIIAWLGGIGER